ncbi:MAG: hypothetical protein JXR04_00865 [Bermanella sp.]
MKLSKFTLFLALIFSASISQANSDQPLIKTYKAEANLLLKQLNEKSSDQIEQLSKNLVNTSQLIISQVNNNLPQCKAYFLALLNAADTMADLPLEEIESGYHADGLLPPLKDATCYHAKDLLVHPATVQAMARIGIQTDEQWQDAKQEIVEVLAHLGAVNNQL